MTQKYDVRVIEVSSTRWWSILIDLLCLRLPGPTSAERRSLFVKITDRLSGDDRLIPAPTAAAARQAADEIAERLMTMEDSDAQAWIETL